MEGGLGHQRRFMEAGQYQLEFAGIGVDVADGENAGGFAFEPRRVHRDQIFVKIDAEFGDGAQLDGEPEERQEGVGLVMPFAFVGAGQGNAFEPARLAMNRLDRGDMEFDLAFLFQLTHLVDAMLGGAEAVAVMNQCE